VNWITDRAVQWSERFPRRVLWIAFALLVVAGALAATIQVDGSRHTMVSADHPHQARQVAWFERFGYPNTLVLVVSGGEAEERRALIDAFAADVRTEDALRDRVIARVGPSDLAELLLLGPRPRPPVGVDALGYLSSPDGHQHYAIVEPSVEGTQQAHEVAPVVERVRAARDSAQRLGEGDDGASAVQADVTGPAALVVDEEREIRRGILTTSGATALLVFLLLWANFRTVRHALLALTPVVLGVVVTMAFARVAFGELNMVTSSCSSILLGLGIDYGVFLLSRYGALLRAGQERDAAIRGMARKTGMALVIGGVTTALAFLTTATTEFTAYARLGVIIAVGLGGMLLATLLLMPSLLQVVGGQTALRSPSFPAWDPAGRWAPLVSRSVVVVAVVATLVSGWVATGVGFNSRFYDFLPDATESARALRAIEHDPLVTPLRANVAVDDLEEARALTERLRALATVGTVHSPTDAFAPVDVERLRARLAGGMPPNPPEALERAWTTALRVSERGAILPSDLPALLRLQHVSADQRAVGLHIVPSSSIWDAAFAAEFAQEVQSVAPEATGLAMHVSAHLGFIRDGFLRAAAASAVLILLVLAFAFRGLRAALLAFLPALVGFTWMLGVMRLFGIPFDPANVVALPLLLGIGVDAGVHLMHRYEESRVAHGVARFDEVVGETGAAVALASATTASGFGALLLADYGAMVSLGLLMTLGIGTTLLASLVVLPALLVMAGKLR
jgi:predicted RND superfamily exporter protein